MSNNIFTTLLSVYLLITSIYLYKKTNQPKILMYIYLVMVLSAIILFIIYGLAYYFTGDGIDEATIYHLEYGLSGAGFLEYSWLIISTLIVFILGMLSLAIIILRQNNTKSAYTINPFWLLSFLGISLLLNPAVIDFYNIKKEFSGAISSKNLTNFNKSYRKPDIKESKKRHKNIVFIYAESLERTYFDNEMFPGLIKGLREIELKNLSFTNIKQVSGTGWTVAGITASQCGLPLFTASHGNSMSGMDNFLPSVICLGDILKEKGYQLNYMGGASLDFAGKGKLFKTHGFSNVLGRDELLPKIENKAYKTGWGLYDDSLFDMVYEHFSELSKTDKKFGIFMLTLDTHHPNGHPSKSCKGKEYKEGDNSILNAVSCSDYLISNFIKKISKSSYADKTLVVLVSDHLAMRNSAYDLLKKNDRRNLFMVIEPGKNSFSKVDTIGSTMDIGSTILPFLGYTGDIGLGRDLLNSENLEKDRFFIHSNIKKWRQPITAFWNFPKIKNSLEINTNKSLALIDSRIFKIPILIELNNKLESILKFQFDKSSGHKTIVQHLVELERNKYFILIDYCKSAKIFDESLSENGFCLLAGQGNNISKIMKLNKKTKFTANEIRGMLNLKKIFPVKRVAHAGGGIKNSTYTNSIDALEINIKKGFQYFEIDFTFTKDNKLVCLHDWKHSFQRSFGFKIDGKVTLKEFNNLVKNKSKFNKCTLKSLAEWMVDNPSAYIVTDIKEENVNGLKEILEMLPNADHRVIPQVYEPKNLETVRNMGFKQIIWTLYRFNGSNKEVLNWVEKFKTPIAITMPKSRAKSTLPKDLEKKEIPTYVHTINTIEEQDKYINKFKITEIYTDFLQPQS